MTSTSTASKPAGRRSILKPVLLGIAAAVLLMGSLRPAAAGRQDAPPAQPVEDNLFRLLGIQPSEESLDYVMNKTQFQLSALLTEQRHPKTMGLSEKVLSGMAGGLQMLFSVDEDVAARLDRLAAEPRVLQDLSSEIESALLQKRKVYIYGCGATGRLAKQMESSFWRPFWKRVKSEPSAWAKLQAALGAEVEDRLIGEMTGGDRALISSLEGFEDLQLIGRLQLEDRKVEKGDVVICVTEGGETSSVIGAVLAALDQWKRSGAYTPEQSRRKLYFVYNNPDDKLLPFERSRKVIQEPGITKINLTTGPQAITGSTRMQAATIETYVLAQVLQDALGRTLKRFLSRKDMARLGFGAGRTLAERLGQFAGVLKAVKGAVPELAPFSELEAKTYQENHFATYFAGAGLLTVFIDSTERSPTFRLYPLDTVTEPRRRCWIQVWTPATGLKEAWQALLGRPFRGLGSALYQKPFEESNEDSYLQTAALESLKKAGDDQQNLYDFSFAEPNARKRGPQKEDLGVAVCLGADESALEGAGSPFRKFVDVFESKGGRAVVISVGSGSAKKPSPALSGFLQDYGRAPHRTLAVSVRVPEEDDAFALNQHIALKILLNAHSTAVMARLGKVVGNTMTNVSPSNLKLIGRATFLVQSHINDVLSRPAWVQRFGFRRPVTYGEANSVLFESVRFLKDNPREAGQTAEVALSIIRVLESLRQKRGLPSEEALALVRTKGLNRYLRDVTIEEKLPRHP
jgi:N-acetylmuramic acid 6-phosphate etherase